LRKNKIICLIPAKGKSTRLPEKNILDFCGHPLIAHSIRKAVVSKLFDTICVSTDSDKIAKISRSYGAEVPFMRPEKLSHDPATISDVMRHTLNSFCQSGLEFEHMMVLLPTAPFVSIDDLLNAYDLFINNQTHGLLSVSKTEFPPYNAWRIDIKSKILVHCFPDSPYAKTKSTEVPETYRSNGAILIVDVAQYLKSAHYLELELMPYIMKQEKSLDIDTKFEYEQAVFLSKSHEHELTRGLFE